MFSFITTKSSGVDRSCTPAAVFQFDLSCYPCQKIDLDNKFRRSWYGLENNSGVSFLLYYFHIWRVSVKEEAKPMCRWKRNGQDLAVCVVEQVRCNSLHFWGLFLPELSILFHRGDIFPHNIVCGHFFPLKLSVVYWKLSNAYFVFPVNMNFLLTVPIPIKVFPGGKERNVS